jgi:shikimate kinase
MKLYLIGLPGSGKSFLGKQLAEQAKVPFIDLDNTIEQEVGVSISEIFSDKGEEYFRSLEAVVLRHNSLETDFVMACGGGTPCFHDNMRFMNTSGKTIFLDTPISEIISRLNTSEQQNRPLLAGTKPERLEEKLNELLEKRISFYSQASITVTDQTSPEQILSLLKK